MTAPIIIVGAGQAGLQAAESLRGEGFAGPLLLVGDEPHLPYQRPPLSKALLLGQTTEDRLSLRGAEALAKQGIEVLTGARIAALDTGARRLTTSAGRTLAYSGLVLATGARARMPPIPGIDLDGVLSLRTIEDVRRLQAALESAGNVVIIGGGFVGLEVAASARKLGKSVSVLEALDRPMARAVTPLVAQAFVDLHRAQGTRIELGVAVAAIAGEGGRVRHVTTGDGRTWPADVVVVGVGMVPNDDLARAAGIACDRGIIVDDCSRTSASGVVAAGDCTARRLPDGSLSRLESVQNAVEQGKAAAAALLGKERPFTASPWFWSDQYHAKLQMAGLSAGAEQTAVRGSIPDMSFAAFYFKAGMLIGCDTVNRPQDHMVTRRLLDRRISPTFAQAQDPGFALNSLLK